MIKTIKRTLSGNLCKPRVRFAALENIYDEGSIMEGETLSRTDGEGSTMEGDTISSASTPDSMSVPNEDPTEDKEGDGVDFEGLQGVAMESLRALALSAWLVTDTVMAVGSEIIRLPRHCGMGNSVETSETTSRFVEADQKGNPGRLKRLGRKTDSGNDDSSLVSYPPSGKKNRRKGRFAFLGGLSNRAKKSFQPALPSTVSVLPPAPLQKKVPPKKPAPPKAKKETVKDLPKAKGSIQPSAKWRGGSKDHSPARAKKLFTSCFVKKPVGDDVKDDTILHSRYRTDQEDLELMGEQTVFTIRLSRVQSREYEDLL